MKNELHELMAQSPFIPFDVVMNSGDRYEVRMASMAVVTKDLLHIFRPKCDRRDVLRLTEISSLEVLEPA